MPIYIRGETYWIDFRFQGARYRRAVANAATDGGKKKAKKAAEDALASIKSRIAAGTFDPGSFEPSKPPDGVLFERAVEVYLEHRLAQGRRESSFDPLKRWLAVFEGRPVASITTEEIEDHLSRWTKERKLRPASRNRLLANLAGLFSYCYGRRWIDSHPTERGRVPRLPEDNARTRWLRPSEIEAIIGAALAMADEVDEAGNHAVNDHGRRRWLATTFPALFRFGCMTGMRVSEVCGLRRSSYQLDSQGRAFVVTEKPTKNRTYLKWPLEGDALAIVTAQLAAIPDKAEAYLFPGPWGEASRGAVNRNFPAIVRKAGLVYGRKHPEGIVWHTTRHTMASLALNNGVPEPVVMALGNWKSRALVARYSHLADETARDAAGKLASIVARGHAVVTTAPRRGAATVRKR